MDPDGAAWLLFELGRRYYQTGQWELAADTFRVLTQRYPDHLLARPAMLWLLQYGASGEAAKRGQVGEENPLQAAMQLGDRLEQTQPELFAEPVVQFPLAAVCRRLDQPRQAERFYQAAIRAGTAMPGGFADGEVAAGLRQALGRGTQAGAALRRCAVRPRWTAAWTTRSGSGHRACG